MTSTILTEKFETESGFVERKVRVSVPVLVSFSSESYAIREFTLKRVAPDQKTK